MTYTHKDLVGVIDNIVQENKRLKELLSNINVTLCAISGKVKSAEVARQEGYQQGLKDAQKDSEPEEHEQEIYRGGDEVTDGINKCIVLDELYDDDMYVLTDCGCVEQVSKFNWKKTGKHYCDFDELISQLGRANR